MEPQVDIKNITSYVDGEITSLEESLRIKTLIETSAEFKFEYEVQSGVKSLLQERFSSGCASIELRENILKSLRAEVNAIEQSKKPVVKKINIIENIIGFFTHPVPALAALAGIFFIFIYFFTFGTPERSFIFDREHGEYNMVERARENFSKILSGELKPQFTEVNPQQIKNFFKTSGVKYETVIPECKYWKILGSVVSDCKGEKLAHTVYTSPKGEVMYLFQVDEEYFTKYKTLDVSEDLMQALKSEKYLKFSEEGTCIFMWKHTGKIFTLISNGNSETIETDFLAQLI